jgi:hypothetical protein
MNNLIVDNCSNKGRGTQRGGKVKVKVKKLKGKRGTSNQITRNNDQTKLKAQKIKG